MVNVLVRQRWRPEGLEESLDGFDLLRAIVRWIHAVAAVVWVGGSIFYLFVLRPALTESQVNPGLIEPPVNRRFRDLVDLSIIALIVTGVIITFDRLSSAPITKVYFTVLALKIVTALAMLFFARELGTRFRPRKSASSAACEPFLSAGLARGSAAKWLSPSRLVLVLGLLAFLLSMLLVHVFERGITNP